jgi:hypothetical protein
MQRKLSLEVTADELYYLLFYIRIRIADPFFDYQNHHIFRAPSSRHYPRWSQKLKSLANKYEITPASLHPSLPIPSEMTPQNTNSSKLSPKLSPINQTALSGEGFSGRPYLKSKKSSQFFDSDLPSPSRISISSLDAVTSSSTSASSSALVASRLPRMKSTSQEIQQLLQEQKEMNKHVAKIFNSKRLR